MNDRSFDQAVKENLEKVGGSDVFVQIFHPAIAEIEKDPWPLFQLALAIYLDKPIVLAVPAGREPPPKLLAIADEVLRGSTEDIGNGLKAYMEAHK